jgi:hypothetical protein
VALWNTLVPVVADIEAGSGQEAVRKLAAALDKAGFIPYDPDREGDAFVNDEDDAEPAGLPGDD